MQVSKLISVEQAVFTSVRGRLASGYQLAATSPGIHPELARELSHWGPAHDSLEDPSPSAQSLNFHPLDEQHWCLSQTLATGAEYSGRRGLRIVTQMFVLGSEAFGSFDFHPIRALQAIQANYACNVSADLDETLRSRRIRVPTRFAKDVDPCLVDRLERFREALRNPKPIAVQSHDPARTLLKRLFDCLAPEDRQRLSFTTGLRHSLRRPFKLYFLPADVRQQKSVLEQTGAAKLEVDFLEASRVSGRDSADRELVTSGLSLTATAAVTRRRYP